MVSTPGVVTVLSVQHVTPHFVMSPYTTLRYATEHSNLLYFTTSHHPLARHTTPHHVTLRRDTPRYATLHYTSITFGAARHTTPCHVTLHHTTPRHQTQQFTIFHNITPPLGSSHHTTSCHATPQHATLRHTPLHFTKVLFIVVLRYSLVSVCCHLSTACPSYSNPRWLAMYWLCSCSPYSAWWVNVLAHSHPKWLKSKFNKISKFRLCRPWIKYISMWKYY